MANSQSCKNDEYSRSKLALYLTGLLPEDYEEAKAVLAMCGELLPVVQSPPVSGGDDLKR